MLYNYLKVILRNFISDGMYTFIIIFGLAIVIKDFFRFNEKKRYLKASSCTMAISAKELAS
jgi:hypothetical protein